MGHKHSFDCKAGGVMLREGYLYDTRDRRYYREQLRSVTLHRKAIFNGENEI